MHAPAHGRESADGMSPFPPAIRGAAEPAGEDPGASGELLEPFSGPESELAAPVAAVEPAPIALEVEPEPALEVEADATPEGEPVLELGAQTSPVEEPALELGADTLLIEEPALELEVEEVGGDAGAAVAPVDAPWEALGRAIDDALSRAAAAAAPPPADWATAGLEELTLEDVAVFADGEILETELGVVAEAEPTRDRGAAEGVEEELERASRDVAEAGPEADADRLAARLESLATRLRLEGPEALDEAVASEDRAEALLAALLAGLRKAGVFETAMPSS